MHHAMLAGAVGGLTALSIQVLKENKASMPMNYLMAGFVGGVFGYSLNYLYNILIVDDVTQFIHIFHITPTRIRNMNSINKVLVDTKVCDASECV